MGQMDLHQKAAELRGKFSSDILSCSPAEENGRPLTRVGQVIEASGKVCIAYKTASCGAGEIRHGDCGTAPVRPIHEGKGNGVTQTLGKEGALGTVIAGILVQQDRSRKARDAVSAVTSKAISIEATVGLSAGVPLMRVMVGHIRHADPGIESAQYEAAGTEIGLDDVSEFSSEVH